MNILYLTQSKIDLTIHGIYSDLINALFNNNHNITIISAFAYKKTCLVIEKGVTKINIKMSNQYGVNKFKKGLILLNLQRKMKKAIKKYLSNESFDLIMYATPPITLAGVVEYCKKKYKAKSYLMLKDIFPQNAVDLEMMTTKGIKSIIYKYFRNEEKKLYTISDKIGCMSQANVDYVLKHNPEILPEKVEICPNCIEPQDLKLTENEKIAMREKYYIPLDKKVFVYGGNLGKPQGIPFIIECLKSQVNNDKDFFLIVGDGTEYGKLENYLNESKQSNFKLMRRMPKEDYDRMISACDVGMIFLDYRFTIPNFPSRLLSYMQAGLPILACTDKNTDIGKVIVDGGFGWWCESNDNSAFCNLILKIHEEYSFLMMNKSRESLLKNYSVEQNFNLISRSILNG